jgi:hypothetical protein
MKNHLIGISVELSVPTNGSGYSKALSETLGGLTAQGMVVLVDNDGELQVLTDDCRLVSSMEYNVLVLDGEALRQAIVDQLSKDRP